MLTSEVVSVPDRGISSQRGCSGAAWQVMFLSYVIIQRPIFRFRNVTCGIYPLMAPPTESVDFCDLSWHSCQQAQKKDHGQNE